MSQFSHHHGMIHVQSTSLYVNAGIFFADEHLALVCAVWYKQLVNELRLNKRYEQEIYWFRLVLFQKFMEIEFSSHKQQDT